MKYHQIDRDLFIKKSLQIYGSNEAKSVAVLTQMIFTNYADSSMPLHSTEIFLFKRCRSRGKHLLAFPDALMSIKEKYYSKRNERTYRSLGRRKTD
jgi:hypothetical protein